ncbi:MAG: spore coat associated protein CotJA [Clostridia bacterium]|nr:spore coat associated protein CotJA [Clostridia bacterium]
MYSENRRNAAVRRSNDEFLRQLIGGELQDSSYGERRTQRSCPTERSVPNCRRQEPSSCLLSERPMYERQSRAESSGPSCNENDQYSPCKDCPTVLNAPALAMVYSPRQCWRGVLSPHDALAAGSLFAELVLPLEQHRTFDGKEACGRKCGP